ncbi:DUF6048 family protein [Roseivirga sp. BDSF3-8]|uniref:DUF6048 family protein n=1 Tax=Roseivirga sp. BDSF3-8 TaxID=3241598 RepID=UPI003531DCF7
MWRYFSSLLMLILVGTSLPAFAQSESDSVRVREKKDWKPSAIRVGTELTGPVFGLFNKDYFQWELTADVDFHRYFLVVDYGYEERIREGQNFRFETSGNYWRAGVDMNFLTTDPSRSVLYFGMRAAGSTFSGDLTFMESDSLLFGDGTVNYTFDKYTATWGEALVGLKVQVLNNVYLGLAGRFKFAININGGLAVSAYEVPGFGVADDNSSFALDYYIYYRIPWRNKGIPPKKK